MPVQKQESRKNYIEGIDEQCAAAELAKFHHPMKDILRGLIASALKLRDDPIKTPTPSA
jgi:hypothetical protein